ncbi:Mesaconyl-C(4)-CoA hydratase [bacterium HR40]|nr:Mesaconyl-C(4)-CoA hydratase [bacterium HR40]
MEDLDRVAQAWIGRSRELDLHLDPFPANALAAALDLERAFAPGDPLPLSWHWLYGHEPVCARDTGADGHPRLGLHLPPLPLSRRMWAGGRLTCVRPLRLGERLRKRITIRDIVAKEGRSGRLVFVTVEERFEDSLGPLLVEERDLVYRETRPLSPAASSPELAFAPALARRFHPDPVLLFRYSALTWNGHRIHYDHAYATGVEGYPGLVVHGPLLATLMCLLAAELAGGELTRFRFRARSPLFADRPLTVEAGHGGDGRILARVVGEDGRVAMEGSGERA